MDAHYQTMYKQAAALQHQFHDYTHSMAHDPMANVLRNQLHGLTNDIASNKNPRTIETRLRGIQEHIRKSTQFIPSVPGAAGPILNHNQSNMLRNNFERMRQSFRQHPNF